MANRNEVDCECGMPARCAANPMIPIEFDEKMNEYHLVRDGSETQMRYCFWCGGRLPESNRGLFFTTPSESEKAEVKELLKGARSHDDVLSILGPADEFLNLGGIVQCEEAFTIPGGISTTFIKPGGKRWFSWCLSLLKANFTIKCMANDLPNHVSVRLSCQRRTAMRNVSSWELSRMLEREACNCIEVPCCQFNV